MGFGGLAGFNFLDAFFHRLVAWLALKQLTVDLQGLFFQPLVEIYFGQSHGGNIGGRFTRAILGVKRDTRLFVGEGFFVQGLGTRFTRKDSGARKSDGFRTFLLVSDG